MIHDVVVVGAGVAGSVVARRLAQPGVRIALVGGDSRPGWEGISARAVEQLLTEGVALPPPSAVRSGRWGGRRVQGIECLIERADLARRLRRLSGDAGAALYPRGARTTRCLRDHWQIELSDGSRLAGRWLIDARGRRGAACSGPKLLSVSQAFTLAAAGDDGTHLEALDAGWCWWARSASRLWLQVTARPRDGHPAGWTQSAADAIPELSALLRGAVPAGDFVARPAHARLAAGSGHASLWRVGDAAFAHDPLSGQGVYQALRSAQLLATVLKAVLDGSDVALAQRFVRERQRADFHDSVRVAGAFYRENEARGDFWRNTAAEYERLAAQVTEQVAGAPYVDRRPVLLDGSIVERDVVITAAHPRGVWQVAGVPLAALMSDAACASPSNLESTAHRLGKPLQSVRNALLWLQQAGAHAGRRPQLS